MRDALLPRLYPVTETFEALRNLFLGEWTNVVQRECLWRNKNCFDMYIPISSQRIIRS